MSAYTGSASPAPATPPPSPYCSLARRTCACGCARTAVPARASACRRRRGGETRRWRSTGRRRATRRMTSTMRSSQDARSGSGRSSCSPASRRPCTGTTPPPTTALVRVRCAVLELKFTNTDRNSAARRRRGSSAALKRAGTAPDGHTREHTTRPKYGHHTYTRVRSLSPAHARGRDEAHERGRLTPLPPASFTRVEKFGSCGA